MNKIWMAVVLETIATLSSGAERAIAADKPAADITIFILDTPPQTPVVVLAELEAGRILRTAGLSTTWHFGRPGKNQQGPVIQIVMRDQTPQWDHPGALAYTNLAQESGTRVQVFYDRVRGTRLNPDPYLLGHVLAHEITHVIEGTPRHSASGLMKAHWDPAETAGMATSPLPLAAEDVEMIQRWKAAHDRPAQVIVDRTAAGNDSGAVGRN